MSKRRKWKPGEACVYCGWEAPPHDQSEDHVFPRTLYPPDPVTSPKLRACKHCAAEKSRGEGSLRDIVTSTTAHQVDLGAFERSLRKGHSILGGAQVTAVDLVTQSGIWIGNTFTATLPPNSKKLAFAQRSVAYLVRGIHFLETGTPLLKRDTSVEAKFLDVSDVARVVPRFMSNPLLNFSGRAESNPTLVQWLGWARTPEEWRHEALLLICFRESTLFFARVYQLEEAPPSDPIGRADLDTQEV